MKTYISLLRGINVSGHKKIVMADLKKLYETLDFKNVTTYIQSGNVIFESATNKNLEQRIEKAISDTFTFEVPVIITTAAELKKIIENNPFIHEKNIDTEKLHVTFLAKEPKIGTITAHYEPDSFTIIGKAIYLYCPNGYGRTKLTNTFFEKKLDTQATTRNWKTVLKLSSMSQL